MEEVSSRRSGKIDGKTGVSLVTSYLCTGDPLWTDHISDPALRALCVTFRSAVCDHDLPDLRTIVGWVTDINSQLGAGERKSFQGCMQRELVKLLEKLFCWGERSKVYMRACLGFARMWTCEHTDTTLCIIMTNLYPKANSLVENLSAFCPKHLDDIVHHQRVKRQYDVSTMIDLVRTMVCRVDTIRQISGYIENHVVTDLPGITELADLLSGAACCVLDSIIN